MKKKSRLLALFLAALMTLSLLAACGKQEPLPITPSDTPAGDDAQTPDDSQEPAEPTEKVLRSYISDTPETFNPHQMATDYYLMDKLCAVLYAMVYDEEQQARVYIDELADGDPYYPDPNDVTLIRVNVKTGYTFTDGTPITAHTFEESMRLLNDPLLLNRNVYASNLVGGEEYLAGQDNSDEAWAKVGYKAIDDTTLEIHFLPDYEPADWNEFKLNFCFAANGVIHPEMYKSCISEDGTQCTYGTSLDTFVCSGPYEVTALIPGQSYEVSKRTDDGAPLKDFYTPDRLTYVSATDTNTQIQLFENGEVDSVVANQAAYDEYADNARYWYQKDNMGIYLYGETPTCEALKDVNLRYALYWGLDRESVVTAVFPISDPCAYQFMDFATMPDPADPLNKVVNYRETPEAQAIRIDGHPTTKLGYDPDLAKEYFDKAYESYGKKIEIVANYGDSGDTLKQWAEALQDHYNTLFGIDRFEIKLQAVPFAMLYEQMKRDVMDFDMIVSCGWNMDPTQAWNNTNWVYSGPWTYNTQYCSIADPAAREEWDDLFYKCALYDYKRNPQKRLESMARMEEILLNDCCFIPAYFRGARYFFSDRVDPIAQQGEPELGFAMWQTRFN